MSYFVFSFYIFLNVKTFCFTLLLPYSGLWNKELDLLCDRVLRSDICNRVLPNDLRIRALHNDICDRVLQRTVDSSNEGKLGVSKDDSIIVEAKSKTRRLPVFPLVKTLSLKEFTALEKARSLAKNLGKITSPSKTEAKPLSESISDANTSVNAAGPSGSLLSDSSQSNVSGEIQCDIPSTSLSTTSSVDSKKQQQRSINPEDSSTSLNSSSYKLDGLNPNLPYAFKNISSEKLSKQQRSSSKATYNPSLSDYNFQGMYTWPPQHGHHHHKQLGILYEKLENSDNESLQGQYEKNIASGGRVHPAASKAKSSFTSTTSSSPEQGRSQFQRNNMNQYYALSKQGNNALKESDSSDLLNYVDSRYYGNYNSDLRNRYSKTASHFSTSLSNSSSKNFLELRKPDYDYKNMNSKIQSSYINENSSTSRIANLPRNIESEALQLQDQKSGYQSDRVVETSRAFYSDEDLYTYYGIAPTVPIFRRTVSTPNDSVSNLSIKTRDSLPNYYDSYSESDRIPSTSKSQSSMNLQDRLRKRFNSFDPSTSVDREFRFDYSSSERDELYFLSMLGRDAGSDHLERSFSHLPKGSREVSSCLYSPYSGYSSTGSAGISWPARDSSTVNNHRNFSSHSDFSKCRSLPFPPVPPPPRSPHSFFVNRFHHPDNFYSSLSVSTLDTTTDEFLVDAGVRVSSSLPRGPSNPLQSSGRSINSYFNPGQLSSGNTEMMSEKLRNISSSRIPVVGRMLDSVSDVKRSPSSSSPHVRMRPRAPQRSVRPSSLAAPPQLSSSNLVSSRGKSLSQEDLQSISTKYSSPTSANSRTGSHLVTTRSGPRNVGQKQPSSSVPSSSYDSYRRIPMDPSLKISSSLAFGSSSYSSTRSKVEKSLSTRKGSASSPSSRCPSPGRDGRARQGSYSSGYGKTSPTHKKSWSVQKGNRCGPSSLPSSLGNSNRLERESKLPRPTHKK